MSALLLSFFVVVLLVETWWVSYTNTKLIKVAALTFPEKITLKDKGRPYFPSPLCFTSKYPPPQTLYRHQQHHPEIQPTGISPRKFRRGRGRRPPRGAIRRATPAAEASGHSNNSPPSCRQGKGEPKLSKKYRCQQQVHEEQKEAADPSVLMLRGC